MAEAVSNKAIPFLQETDEAFFAESLLRLVYKIILVIEEKEPGNPPHVIVPVGVVKLHGPPLFSAEESFPASADGRCREGRVLKGVVLFPYFPISLFCLQKYGIYLGYAILQCPDCSFCR